MKMTVMMKKKAKSGSEEKFKWENLIAANFPDDENSQQTLIKFNLLGKKDIMLFRKIHFVPNGHRSENLNM